MRIGQFSGRTSSTMSSNSHNVKGSAMPLIAERITDASSRIAVCGHQPCPESICNHFRQPIDIVLGRESRPVSRAVFKTVGGRQTVPVGSTPTLFRHNFIILRQRKGYSSASTGMPYSSSLWSTSFKPCSFAIRSLSASISELVKQTTSPVLMLMR